MKKFILTPSASGETQDEKNDLVVQNLREEISTEMESSGFSDLIESAREQNITIGFLSVEEYIDRLLGDIQQKSLMLLVQARRVAMGLSIPALQEVCILCC